MHSFPNGSPLMATLNPAATASIQYLQRRRGERGDLFGVNLLDSGWFSLRTLDYCKWLVTINEPVKRN